VVALSILCCNRLYRVLPLSWVTLRADVDGVELGSTVLALIQYGTPESR
jgi:hypothetical protein